MNEQFIEHWRQVAEFDYPALQAELAALEAARERAEEALKRSHRARREGATHHDFDRCPVCRYFAHAEEGKG